MWYAERIRRNPEKSPVFELDRKRKPAVDGQAPEPVRWGRPEKSALLVLGSGVVLLVAGILALEWYIEEIAALFLAIGILAGFAARMRPSVMAASFVKGAAGVMNVTLIIALGRAILIVLQEAAVLDTVLASAAGVISSVPKVFTAQMMFLTQAAINFFIHSGTAQAALTMPVMAPLSDLVGITRQTTVLAFQLCEVVNPILPTSAVTMGVLGVAGIPWEKWAKWFLPLMMILVIFSLIALVPPVLMNWGPF
jgi:uncharacterized ion transporter superfamily protein YfcC